MMCGLSVKPCLSSQIRPAVQKASHRALSVVKRHHYFDAIVTVDSRTLKRNLSLN